MDDLISRTALLKECSECQKTDPRFEERGWASHFLNDAGGPSTEWYCVEDMIENAPAVDAVPVVRCRYCKYSVEAKNAKGEYRALCGNSHSICCSSSWTLPEDWYCADGERRVEDGSAD